jgi:hypothetical protein
MSTTSTPLADTAHATAAFQVSSFGRAVTGTLPVTDGSAELTVGDRSATVTLG